MIEKNMLEVNQPIGTFYLSVFTANEILNLTDISQREYNSDTLEANDAVQRLENSKRVSNISLYTQDPDATFPTPIIIAVDSSKVQIEKEKIFINKDIKIGEIIDGQHRLLGIKKSGSLDLELPVVIMFDLTIREKAYIFSSVNSNQVIVPKSLIYDLYGITDLRSPFKTCHEIARALNKDENSPFFKKLKMLGKRTSVEQTLSQGTFVKALLDLISNNPQRDEIDIKNNKVIEILDNDRYPFRKNFDEKDDHIIYKILLNIFSAIAEVLKEEWRDGDNFILSKSTGYEAIVRSIPELIKIGKQNSDLSYDFFKNHFEVFKKALIENDVQLTSSYFPSNSQTQTLLSKLVVNPKEVAIFKKRFVRKIPIN